MEANVVLVNSVICVVDKPLSWTAERSEISLVVKPLSCEAVNADTWVGVMAGNCVGKMLLSSVTVRSDTCVVVKDES